MAVTQECCKFDQIDVTQTGAISPDQNGPRCNGNEPVCRTLEIFWTGASTSDAV